MNEKTINQRIRALTGVSTDVISDSDLSTIIGAALDEFLWYRPGLQLTVAANGIETVSSQPNYDLPSDALWIIEVCWNPDQLGWDASDGILDNLYLELSQDTFDPNHPSELHAIYQRFADFRHFFQGRWKIVNDEIWLVPPPSTNGDHVAIFYAKTRSLADLNAVTDHPFSELCKGLVLDRWATQMESKADWRAGSLAVGTGGARSMRTHANRTLERGRALCANSYYAESTGPGFAVRSQ